MLVDVRMQHEMEEQVNRLVEEVEEIENKRADVVDELAIEVAKEVVEQLQDLLPTIVAQVGTLAIKGTSEVKMTTPLTTASMKMIGMLTWEMVEKTEAVQEISGYEDNHKVKYSTGSLTGRALTWWSSEVKTRGQEAAFGMTWEDFKALMKEEYCPSNEMQKLETEF
ncbi:reverse transcriptase domain-containing protein [Tanacetum coccineum]